MYDILLKNMVLKINLPIHLFSKHQSENSRISHNFSFRYQIDDGVSETRKLMQCFGSGC